MSNLFSFDGYSEFEGWCVANGYAPDEMYDQTEERGKYDTWMYFYVKNIEENTYAEISVLASYDYGWQEGEIHQEGLARKVTQVMTEKVEYVK